MLSGKKEIQNILLSWFAANQRNLPWRESYDPYHIWISEIMGQQTQMDRVVQYFQRWLKLFPDVNAVAEARQLHILKAWEGLGYYSRARNIQKTARILVREYSGLIPADMKQLLHLPGIGPYTAAAILSIAYNKPVPLLDANVERVFSRLLDLEQSVKLATVRKQLHLVAEDLLPKQKARQFNQALMEFGALVCRPKSPDCVHCPLTDLCRARQHGTVSRRPLVVNKVDRVEIIMACGVIYSGDRIYIQQRLADDVWGGLWEFPGGRLKEGESPEEAACREIYEETEFSISRLQPLATVTHHYSRYRVTLHGFVCRLQSTLDKPILHAASQYRWLPLSGLSDFPFPAGHRQLLARISS